jgi:hypothetical protein
MLVGTLGQSKAKNSLDFSETHAADRAVNLMQKLRQRFIFAHCQSPAMPLCR